jgi:hypothetical protein
VNHIVTGSRGLYNEPGDKYFKPDVPMNIVKMHVNRNRGIIEIMINLEFKGEKVTVIVYPFTKDILVIIKNSKADIREFEQAVGLN